MAVTTLGYAPSSSLGGTGMGYVVGGPSTTSLMPLGSSGSGSGSGSGVWMSPYETQQYNLNRNPAYRSYYDLPAEVRNNPLAPSDYLPLSESYHVPGLSHPFGGLTSSSNPSNPSNHPVQPAVPFNAFQGKAIEMQRCRIRIMGQRVSTDVNPAVHLAGFLLFDANGLPIRTAPDAVASCTSGGISPLGEEPQKAVDDSLGTRFTRKGFSTFPVDLEIDLRRTVAVASYAWRTAEDRPELDPVAWVFQAYFPHGWVTLDSATEYPTPIHRFAMVGPFRADGRSGNEVTDPAGAGGGGGANPSSPPRISPNLFAGPNALSPPHNQHHPQNLYGYGAGFDPVQAQAARKASEYLHEFVGDGCRQDNPEGRVRELLARGADPNFKDGKGRTTFMKACARAPVPIIAELIRHGADVNSQSLSGETGLHRLVLWGDQEPIALLLRSGANPNLQDAQGDSPLMIASARMDVDTVRLLLQHGASPALRNHKGLSAQDMLELEVRKQVGPGQPYPPHGTQVWSMLTGRPTPQAPPPGLATPMPPGAIPVPVQPVPIIQPQPSGGGGGGGGGAPIAPGYPPPPGPSNLANNRPPPIQPYR